MEILTVQDAIAALPKKKPRGENYRDNRGYVAGALEGIYYNGYFTPLVGNRAVEVATKVNMISAQRLIENFPFSWQKAEDTKHPKPDFQEYSRLYLLALRRLGLKAGGNLGRNYPKFLKLGASFQDCYDQTELAVRNGGKVFGGYFVHYLPDVIAAGGKIQEFHLYSTQIRRAGGVKTARAFMKDAALMYALQEPTFPEIAQTLLDGINEVTDKDGSFWVARFMTPFVTMGYHPQCYMDRLRDAYYHPANLSSHKKGSKTVKWLAYGVGNIATTFQHLKYILENDFRPPSKDIWDREWKLDLPRFPFEFLREENLKRKFSDKSTTDKAADLAAKLSRLDLDNFHGNYLGLLAEVGYQAAIFYSLMTNTKYVLSEDFANIPTSLIRLRQAVPKTVSSQAMWFIPKMARHEEPVIDLIDNIIDYHAQHGKEATIQAIRYTYGVNRRGTYTLGLISPGAVGKKEYTEKEWDNDPYGGNGNWYDNYNFLNDEPEEIPF